MAKHTYVLSLAFSTDKKDKLYEGDSWYNKTITDHISITKDRIEIDFSRSSKISPDYMYTSSSPVRYQLYRAACFYLAVVGSLPPVQSIDLSMGNSIISLDPEQLTSHWENCKIEDTLSIDIASKCFLDDGKYCHIVMTYFLKAQLDPFPHDSFRAAWSGINALYNYLYHKKKAPNKDHESNKIRSLKEYIRNHTLTNAESYASKLPNDFWTQIQWYNYSQKETISKIEKNLINNTYRDKVIYQKLANYVCAIYERDSHQISPTASSPHEANYDNRTSQEKAETIRRKAEKVICKKTIDGNERVRFLVCDYCYMLRNRSFHALKPYPVFSMFNNDTTSAESMLTKLMILTISDLLPYIYAE